MRTAELECCRFAARLAELRPLGLQATGFIAAVDLEPFLRCLRGSLALLPVTKRSEKLKRLLALQIPLQVSVQFRALVAPLPSMPSLWPSG